MEELELYAPVPEGYRLVGFREVRPHEFYLVRNGEIDQNGDLPWSVHHPRMIIEKIKPKIIQRFDVQVTDEVRPIKGGELGWNAERKVFMDYRCWPSGSGSEFNICIVTEIEVEKC